MMIKLHTWKTKCDKVHVILLLPVDISGITLSPVVLCSQKPP